MNRIDFEILSYLATGISNELQKDLWNITEANIKERSDILENEGFLNNGCITRKGLDALEPYRVKRAILLAAGFGSRMKPITINTPKPMVRVNGNRIIETIIESVLAAGIEEIYIVRGYLGEEFELLKKKYPMIQFIDNLYYARASTISSFYYARELLESAYVLESDLVVQNPNVIKKYNFSSNFAGTKVLETDDWFFKVKNGVITDIGVNGRGDDCYKLIGISYWSTDDGKKLSHDIKEAFEGPDGMKLYMSYVPLVKYKEKYQVEIMPCNYDDIVEIDSFKELQEYDSSYLIELGK